MDSQPKWMKQSGATPGKLGLIGVLAAVLSGVVFIQFRPTGTDQSPTVTTPNPRPTPATSQPKNRVTEAVSEVPAKRVRKRIGSLDKWRSPELASVIQYDPFALPASFPQPQRAVEGSLAQEGVAAEQLANASRVDLEKELQDIRAQLETLRSQGVHVIIQRQDEYVAMIGDRTIHVGDEINGFKVVNIDSDGVQVAREVNQ